MYACTEWVEDAFKGREPLLEIYSRLLNPTSISLANHIVDLEAGPLAGEYLAWNFNSGMAAIDATLANLVGYQDVVLASRNVYGGTYQLLHDWYGKQSNLDVAVRMVRRLHGGSLPPRADGSAGEAPDGWPKAATSTCSSSRRATRTATCSTCRRSAARRTSSASP
jgi:O-acetylhomoserine (thiol)-lyase